MQNIPEFRLAHRYVKKKTIDIDLFITSIDIGLMRRKPRNLKNNE